MTRKPKRKPDPVFWLLVLAVAVLICWSTVCHGAGPLDTGGWRASADVRTAEGLWEWSPAADYHRAVVRVVNPANGNVGSGVWITFGDCAGVLTARHVADGPVATCTFSEGTTSYEASVTHDKFNHDLAFIFTPAPAKIPAIELADSPPLSGSRVEFVSLGGPDHKLRHFYGLANGNGSYEAVVASGDSGCPILDANHRLVGIQSYGRSPSLSGNWGVYRGSGGTPFPTVKGFCDRIAAGGCRPGGCGPDGCRPERPRGRGIEWGGRIGFYPPSEPRQKPAGPPPILPGPAPLPIETEIPVPDHPDEPTPECEKGDKGDKGDRGEPGESPSIDEIIARLKTDREFLLAVAALVKIDPKTLPPIHVKVEVLDAPPDNPQLEQDVYLGGTLPLRLFPLPPQPK